MQDQANPQGSTGPAPTPSELNMKKLEETLELYFVKKAPALPANVKEAIVKYGPYVMVVLILFSLPVLLAAFGLSAAFAPFGMAYGYRWGVLGILSTVVLLASLVLEGLAIPSLLKRSKNGWNLMYYSSLVSLAYQVITFNLAGFIIGGLISFYILFQVKEYYK